jgi:hypothetical protein
MRHLADALAAATCHPRLLPLRLADRVHELLVDLDAAGVGPQAPPIGEADEPSERLPLEAGSRAPIVGEATIAACRSAWTWNGPSPYDPLAERTLAGIALTSQADAWEVYMHVPENAWHDRVLREIVVVSTQVDDDDPGVKARPLKVVKESRRREGADADHWSGRVGQVADLTGHNRHWLVSLISNRLADNDNNGHLAARVIAANIVRAEITDHLTALQRLDLHITIAEPDAGAGPERRQRLRAYADRLEPSPWAISRPVGARHEPVAVEPSVPKDHLQ